MITWLTYWPVLLLPTPLLLLPALLPSKMAFGFGGGVVRQWYVNNLLLPLLPYREAAAVVEWFAAASIWQEWGIAAAIVVNVNVLLLPLLYLVGVVVIKLSSWIARTDIDLKRRAIH